MSEEYDEDDPLAQVVAELSAMPFDKAVTRAELKAVLKSGGDYSQWVADTLFDIIDDDSNGLISPAEFFQWKKSVSNEEVLTLLNEEFEKDTLDALSDDGWDSAEESVLDTVLGKASDKKHTAIVGFNAGDVGILGVGMTEDKTSEIEIGEANATGDDDYANAVVFLKNMDFDKFDTSEDSKVTRDELRLAMAGAGEHSDWVAATVFDIIDEDHSGWISTAELLKWKDKTTAEDLIQLLKRKSAEGGSVAIEMQGLLQADLTKMATMDVLKEAANAVDDDSGTDDDRNETSEQLASAFDMAEVRKAFWKQKEEEIEEEKQREFEEETALTQQFKEYFDLSMGLQIRPVSELYDFNLRPLAFTVLNILLILPSQMTTTYYIASAPGVLFNAFILLVGAIAEMGSFNVAEVYCGDCGRRAFSYTPGKHYSVLDSWFNIEAYRDKSVGMTLTHADKEEEHAMLEHDEYEEDAEDKAKELRAKAGSSSIAYDDEEREERELDEKMRDIHKGRERMANMQIVPPPFSYVATLGFLFMHLILGASNAYYTSALVISADYKGDHRSSWNQYCKGDDWDTKPARQNGECLIRFSAYLAVASFSSFSLFCSVILARNVRSRPMSWIKVAKSSLLAKFPGNEAHNIPSSRTLLNRIERRLMRIKSMHHYKWHFDCCGRKVVIQYISVLNVLFSALLILVSLCTRYKWLVEVKAKYWWARLIFLFALALATYSLSFILHVLFRIHALYSIGLQVMVALAKPITVRTIEDLVIWWETRKYYQNFKLPVVYAYGAMSVAFLLCVSIVAIFVLTINILTADQNEAFRKNLRSPTNVLLSLLILLFVYALFKVLLLVVQISTKQMQHIQMLRHEKARLDAYGALYTRRLKEKKVEEQREMVKSMGVSSAHFADTGDTEDSSTESEDEMKSLIPGASGVAVLKSAVTSPLAHSQPTETQQKNTVSNAWMKMRSTWMDMKLEREVAGVGKDSHRLIETMLRIVKEKDIFPKVLGVPITMRRIIALSTYFAASCGSVIIKVIAMGESTEST